MTRSRSPEDDEEVEQQRQLDLLGVVSEHETRRLHSGELPWTQWLDWAAQYGQYGFQNTLRIHAQRPDAGDVRSYREWKAAERQVRKGESGIKIVSERGTPRSVFDVQQTDGPSVEPPRPSSPAEAWTSLRGAASALGLYVDRGERWPYTGRADRLIRIDPGLDDLDAAAKLAHQLAHVLRRGDRMDPQGASHDHCHGERRVEADSVAYLILSDLIGTPPTPSFPQVVTWAGADARAQPLATIAVVGDRLLRTATLLRRRLPVPPPPSESAAPLCTPVTHTAGSRSGVSRDELVAINTAAHAFYRARAADGWARSYLEDRGFPSAVQESWQIGNAPRAWQALSDHLRSRRHSDQAIMASGLARTGQGGRLYDLFRDRVMFTIRDADGLVRGFIGRQAETGSGPKYLNSPDSALFHKSELIYGLHEMRGRLAGGARPVVVEGPLDAIAINMASADHAAVAPCGTAVTAAHLQALATVSDLDNVGLVVALDGDRAGRAGASRAWPMLAQVRGPVGAVVLPEGRDPADILRHLGCAAVREALQSEISLADVVVDAAIERFGGTFDTAEEQLAAARAAARQAALAPPLEASRQAARIVTRTGVAATIVTDLLVSAASPEPPEAAQLAGNDFPLPPLTGSAPSGDSSPAPSRQPGRTHSP